MFSHSQTLRAQEVDDLCSANSAVPLSQPPIGANGTITFLPAGNYTGHLRLAGTIVISGNVNFNGCDLEMADGSLIRVDPGAVFIAQSSDFYSCNRLWQGILNKTHGFLLLDHCRISDAEYAINSDDGANLLIGTTIFNKNHIGIKNGAANPTSPGLALLFFDGNTFDCTSALRGHYSVPTNSIPAYVGWSHSGVYLNQAQATLVSNGAPNLFTHVLHGIYSNLSDLTIGNCRFWDITRRIILAGTSGSGIYSTDGSITTSPLVPFPTVHCANNTTIGIFANGTDLNIQNGLFFVDGTHGIRSQGNMNADIITIRNNTVTIVPNAWTLKRGILVQRNSRAGNQASVDISNNIVNLGGNPTTPDNHIGVELTAINPAIDIAQVISNNGTVNLGDPNPIRHFVQGNAMNSVNADRFWFIGNNVSFFNNNNQLSWGISMLNMNGIQNAMRNNGTIGTGVTATSDFNNPRTNGYCGVHVSDVANLTMCNNAVDDQEHGIHFFGTFPGLGFLGNNMGDHTRGLRVQINTVSGTPGFMPLQDKTGNRWANTFANNNQIHGVEASEVIPSFFPILIVPIATAGIPNSIPANPFPSISVSENGTNETLCPPPPPVLNTDDRNQEQLSDFNLKLVNGTSGLSASLLWEYQLWLLCKLNRFSYLLGQNSYIDLFYSNNQNSSLRDFAQVASLTLQSITESSDLEVDVNYFWDNQQIKNDSILGWLAENAANFASNHAIADSQLVEFHQLKSHLSENQAAYRTLKNERKEQKQFWLEQALAFNESLVPQTVVQANWKFLNYFRLKTALGLQLIKEDWNGLREISRCPAFAGSTAIVSIYMLPLDEQIALLPSEGEGLRGNCNQIRQNDSRNSAGSLKFSIFPNPASNNLTIRFQETAIGTWKIVDFNGKTALSGNCNNRQTESINISSLVSGIYAITISSENGGFSYQKLIVSK